MIYSVKAQNYQSLRDETLLDLTVGQQAPKSRRYLNTTSDIRLTAVQAVMGANASGKTTTLKALAFVAWFMVSSFREDEKNIPVKQFAGYGSEVRPTSFEIVFELNEKVHVYSISLNNSRVLSEELYIRSLTSSRVTAKRLFERRWDEIANKYKFNDNVFNLTEDYWASPELGNTSIISVAARFGNDYAHRLIEYWKGVYANIEIDDSFVRPYQINAYMALRYYESHPGPRKKAETEVRRWDLGIEGFGKEGTVRHKYGDKHFEIEVDQESSGTQQLLALFRRAEKVLKNGGTLVIDELGTHLHPLMTKELVDNFMSPSTNKGKGQLLFCTHDVTVLGYLNKYEITLSEKNDMGITKVRRLDTIPGVRTSDNYMKKYLMGIYGAIPKIDKTLHAQS